MHVDGRREVRRRRPAPSSCRRRRSPVTKSLATPRGDVDVGQPDLLGQRALVEPVEQRHAEPADDAHLREVHVGVDEPGQHHALAEVEDVARPDARRARGEGPAGGDDAVARRASPQSSSARRPPPVNGLTGVSRTVARKRVTGARPGASGCAGAVPARSASKVRTQVGRDADTAMAAGSLPVMLGQPDGRLDPRQSRPRECPSAARRFAEPAPLRRRPDQADRAEVLRTAAPRRTGLRPRRGRGS